MFHLLYLTAHQFHSRCHQWLLVFNQRYFRLNLFSISHSQNKCGFETRHRIWKLKNSKCLFWSKLVYKCIIGKVKVDGWSECVWCSVHLFQGPWYTSVCVHECTTAYLPSAPIDTNFTPLLAMKSRALFTLLILWTLIFPRSGLGNRSPVDTHKCTDTHINTHTHTHRGTNKKWVS